MKLSKLFKVASKSDIRPSLKNLYLKDNTLYATDSYMAIAMHHTQEGEGYITTVNATIADLKKTLPALTTIKEQYPEIGQLFEKSTKNKFITLKINRKYVIDLLEAMQKNEKGHDIVEISLPVESYKPLLFKNDNGTGLIMPIQA